MDEKTERFEMRVPASFLKTIDDWRRKQAELPSRAEAIRRLVELGLKAKGKQ
jgi:metal-responsive CopG/Arc/MetJ family transcriptional regulator